MSWARGNRGSKRRWVIEVNTSALPPAEPASSRHTRRCCMDRCGGKSLPYPVIGSDGGNRDWLGDADHLVEGADGDGDLTFLTGGRSCFELRTDDVFVATDRRFHDAASAIPIGLLPSHSSVLSNVSDVTIANGLDVGFSVDDRRCSRWDDDIGWWIALACSVVAWTLGWRCRSG